VVCPVGLKTGIVEFGHGIPGLMRLGDGGSAFSGANVFVQVDGFVGVHGA